MGWKHSRKEGWGEFVATDVIIHMVPWAMGLISETKPVTPNFYFISETSKPLSVRSRILKKIYRVGNFRANVFKPHILFILQDFINPDSFKSFLIYFYVPLIVNLRSRSGLYVVNLTELPMQPQLAYLIFSLLSFVGGRLAWVWAHSSFGLRLFFFIFIFNLYTY